MIKQYQRRATCLVLLGMLVFTGFSWRLIHLQVAEHALYVERAAQHHLRKETIHARRGAIRDARGEVLAQNRPVRTVAADGYLIREAGNLERTAQLVAWHLGMDYQAVHDRMDTERRYVVLQREVPDEVAYELRQDLIKERLRGLLFEEDDIRIYPNGRMLCHVIGFLNFDREGVSGVERSFNEYLAGNNGYRWVEKDRTGRELVPYRGLEKAAENGVDLHLTIDMGLQMIVEREIDAVVEQYQPRSVTILLTDVHTGEILALANRPDFDPNHPGDFDSEATKNRAIVDMVEPGSTFKIVVTTAALNEGSVRPETMIFCENGRFLYAGRTLRDVRGYGMLSVIDVLVKSSNIGSAKLAMMLGESRYYDYIRRFGFGERTGVELPGEIGAVVHPPSRWDRLSITRIPMGHAVTVTPIQQVMAMAAVANGGELMKPRVVKRMTDERGRALLETRPTSIRRVMTEETALIVQHALEEVTGPRGTARQAQVTGYRVAGKTGTAQRVSPRGGYESGKYVVSFLGYGPAEAPRVACIVLVDDAKTGSDGNYGGLVAAPVFSRVMGQALRYLDVPPSAEGKPLAQGGGVGR